MYPTYNEKREALKEAIDASMELFTSASRAIALCVDKDTPVYVTNIKRMSGHVMAIQRLLNKLSKQ